jgi:hypothetical protein
MRWTALVARMSRRLSHLPTISMRIFQQMTSSLEWQRRNLTGTIGTMQKRDWLGLNTNGWILMGSGSKACYPLKGKGGTTREIPARTIQSQTRVIRLTSISSLLGSADLRVFRGDRQSLWHILQLTLVMFPDPAGSI